MSEIERDDEQLTALEKAVGFDPNFLCIYCEEPVTALSCGGPMICPSCDCGANKDGSLWTHAQASKMYANARRRWAEINAASQPDR